MIKEREPEYDEILVQQIIAAATKHKLMTIGQFSHFARPYLEAGYPREVSEAHRRYFAR